LFAVSTLTEDSNPRGDVEILLGAPERYQPDVLNSQSFDHLIQTEQTYASRFFDLQFANPWKRRRQNFEMYERWFNDTDYQRENVEQARV
jgi:hypothetical protein